MTIFQESKGWDSELPIFNHWCLVLTLAFKYRGVTSHGIALLRFLVYLLLYNFKS